MANKSNYSMSGSKLVVLAITMLSENSKIGLLLASARSIDVVWNQNISWQPTIRFQAITNSKTIFPKLKKNIPDSKQYLLRFFRPISGDCTMPGVFFVIVGMVSPDSKSLDR